MICPGMSRKPVCVVVGTRPEAVKMAPVVRALATTDCLRPVLVSTGQHRDLLATALSDFALTPDFELDVMTAGQTPAATMARILDKLPDVFHATDPAVVLVQGDTTSALAAGLAAFYHRIPVGHVEAGLRTDDFDHPFPEEANRQLVDRISRWCFAPTDAARQNLLRENIPADRIVITGNTAIDALMDVLRDRNHSESAGPYVLVTLHRRESFGGPLRAVASGLLDFLRTTPNARAVWTVHPNPAIRQLLQDVLAESDRVTLLPPQGYPAFARLVAGCRVILTDSGGVQEEAPSLGKRVLVARETTERPEAVATGQNRLIGRSRQRVAEELARAWGEPAYTGPLPAVNPFGDGMAAGRVVERLRRDLGV